MKCNETPFKMPKDEEKFSTRFVSLLREISTSDIAVHTTYDLYCYPKYWTAHIRERMLERDNDRLKTLFPENWLSILSDVREQPDKEQM